ncbi:MAG: DedA family protein [Burkholderiaceae bacterium]|nr:DedA family protein [Burkholderiaceae bacterium]
MEAFFDQVGLLIQTHQFWSGPIIFLLTLGESMLILGIMIPATAILLFTGGLVGSGILDPYTVLIWGVAGAVVGDTISYLIGRFFGPKVLQWRLIKQQRSTVARARLFFYKYGFLSIFFGRFLGPIRSTIPTVAGIMGMSHFRFEIANILSAIVWVPVMLSPGYLAARSIDAAQNASHITLYIGGGLSVVVGVGLLYAFSRKRETSHERRKRLIKPSTPI